MRIDQPGCPGAPGQSLRTRRRQPAFALPQGNAAVPGSELPGDIHEAMAPGLVVLSETGPKPDTSPAAEAQAARQGGALLQAMSGLQVCLLGPCSHGAQAEARKNLADLASSLPDAHDPGLDEVLRAIAQRAAIELARPE